MVGSNEQILNLDERNFTCEVLEADQPVLVDFWAPWCGPCKSLAPTIDRLAAEFAGKVKVAKLDIDDVPQVAEQMGVRGIPNVIVFNGGEKVANIVGAQQHGAYERVLQDLLAGASRDQIADQRIQDPQERKSVIVSADLEDLTAVFARQPELATAVMDDGLTPLGFALKFGLPTEKKELFASYASQLSIVDLAGLGRVNALQSAINADPSGIHQTAQYGMSALFIAAVNGHKDCVDILLKAGADPDVGEVGERRASPIELALFKGDADLINTLLDHGAELALQASDAGGTILHFAVSLMRADMVTLCIDRGVDPLATDDMGQTAYEAALADLKRRSEQPKDSAQAEKIQQDLEQLETLKPILTKQN